MREYISDAYAFCYALHRLAVGINAITFVGNFSEAAGQLLVMLSHVGARFTGGS